MTDREGGTFLVLYITTGVVLLYAAVATLVGTVGSGPHPAARLHAALLAGVEAIAAGLFLVPRAMRVGATVLLVVLAVALLLHAARGEFAYQLLAYAAAVLFVREHGVGRGAGA